MSILRLRSRRSTTLRSALLSGVCALASLGLPPRMVASTVPAASALEGRVTDSAGQRLPGVTVTAMPAAVGAAVRTTTAADGSYRLQLSAGRYRVDHELPGFDLIRFNGVLVGESAVARLDVNLPVSAVCECVDYPVDLEATARPGQVFDDAGRPLPHAQLELAAPGHRFRNYADHEGRFRLRLPKSGTWTLTALDSGFGSETRPLTAGSPADVVFRLKPVSGDAIRNVERLVGPCCAINLLTRPAQLG